MRKIVAVILIVSIATFMLPGCMPKPEVEDRSFEKIQSKGVLVVGLDESFPPMGYIDTNTGELIGFDVDLAKEVSKRLNVEIKFQPINWETKELELSNGNIDCIWNGMSSTDYLDKSLNLSKAYMKNKQCILVKANSPFQHINDLKGKNLCVQNESSAEHALHKNIDIEGILGKVITSDTYTKAIFELENATVDAIGMDEIVARFYMAKNAGLYRLIEDEDSSVVSLAEEDYVIGFKKDCEQLKSRIEDTLKSMAEDDTISSISEKWFSKDITCVRAWCLDLFYYE